MRLFLMVPMLSLTACAGTLTPDAVRDGTVELRKQHARDLIADGGPRSQRSGESLLTALACGWDEGAC